MNHLKILLPFGLPQEEMAVDLLRQMQTPALSAMLGRAAGVNAQSADPFARALPHEYWLARELGLPVQPELSPPVAVPCMRALGMAPGPGFWFILQPAHLHVARDHLVLTDLRQLALDHDAAISLYEAAAALFDEAGRSLLFGDAAHWFLRADDWGGLLTSSPDAACGHNIDIWMPKGPGEREWRKLQNEVQMLWHAHAVNQDRLEHGAHAVNALWMWGGGAEFPAGTCRRYRPGAGRFDILGGDMLQAADAAALIAATEDTALLELNDLAGPALAGDWRAWLDAFHQLEAHWLAPMMAALKDGKLGRISLVLTDGARQRRFEVHRSMSWKFWQTPSLARLAP
jgi:hypothetical protein